jgi:hypothetical protein
MAKTWVLDTETKGTGAHIAPLKEPAARQVERELEVVTFERTSPPAESPAPAPSASFKVVDVMSARVIGEGIDTRATVDLLKRMNSVTDARIYVWAHTAQRWRLLSLREQRTLWAFRAQTSPSAPSIPA